MSIIVFIIIVLISIYEFSFIRFNWKKGNKTAAFGIMLLAFVSIMLSLFPVLRH